MNTVNQLRVVTLKRFSWAVLSITAACTVILSSQPVSAAVVYTNFNDTFENNSTLDSATPSPTTYNSTDYEVASTKNATNSSIAPGDLKLTLNSATCSAWVELMALVPKTTLASTADYVDLRVTFTNGGNLLPAAASALWIGLYNSAGSAPYSAGALATGTLNGTAGSLYATGGSQPWDGFYGGILYSGGASVIKTRPAQTGAGTSSANQELLGDQVGTGAFNNPRARSMGTVTSTMLLTSGSVYTLDFVLQLTASGLVVSNNLYSGSDTSGTLLFSQSATSNGITSISFDALALGDLIKGYSAIPVMDVNSVRILTNIPEPSTLALAGVGIGLMIGVIRRRRR